MIRCYHAARPAVTLKLRTSSLLLSTPAASQVRFYRTTSATDANAFTAAASVDSPSLYAVPTEASPQTYFDYLDRIWNTKWFGTVDEHIAAAATSHAEISDPSWFAQIFTTCQDAIGIEAGALLFLFGAATRLCTLYFSLYGERSGERMRLALPELKKPQEDFNRVYYNDLASAMEVQVAASVLKSHRRAIFRKYSTSNWKCIASLATAPVTMMGLYQASAVCENAALDVGSSSFLWCSALALPDPFMILPVVTCFATLLNFELSISKDIKTGWMRNIIWGARLGCLCVIPVFATLRSGVCLYFVGMNVVGLVQPLLLRSVAFRRWFGFPSTEDLAAVAPPTAKPSPPSRSQVHAKTSSAQDVSDRAVPLRERILGALSSASRCRAPTGPTQDVLQSSLTVQFPYLSHLLNPQVDENEELFAKARNKQSKPDIGRRSPVTTSPSFPPPAGSRYTRGTNPLMRETPLQRRDGVAAAATAARTGSSHMSPDRVDANHRPAAASNSSGSTARSVPRNRGSSFASSGWKSVQPSFEEKDFIPNYEGTDTASSSSPTPPK
ncbi:hypothetical protein ABL78_0184 [Leptomonas seymouri]|uniref:60Kd inner membrane protein n=1 Tax=Leptomonas seymouri TaxID=5684 RepID=A0A0N1PFR8_LEPSE|nr:hypothetical protein ABL78_0184 [Leptomonas seymouri]|eukprot:KPI90748.1 hypothetical protein ABL78_0184 [Leptomonas seymouri]